MKREASISNKPTNRQHQSHASKSAPGFEKVKDGRKQNIRVLWARNGRYYAQLQFEDSKTGKTKVKRVPLVDKETKQPVQTQAQAVEALNRLKLNRADNALPVLHRCPKFDDYVKTYLAWVKAGQDKGQGIKKPKTIKKEEYVLNQWAEDLGGTRLDKISLRHINARIAKRLEAGTSKRTVKIDIIILNNLLNHALDEGLINTLPRLSKEGRKRLKSEPPKRSLFTSEDLETLCTAAMDENEDGSPVTKNWLQFCDYVRLLAYCGAREQEALKLRWSDVDFNHEQLTIGSDGDTKNKAGRTVDFNTKLKAHLQEMHKRLAPDSEWLFPSPQRGDKDIHAQTFRESLKLVRAHAAKKNPAMATKAFHDLRRDVRLFRMAKCPRKSWPQGMVEIVAKRKELALARSLWSLESLDPGPLRMYVRAIEDFKRQHEPANQKHCGPRDPKAFDILNVHKLPNQQPRQKRSGL